MQKYSQEMAPGLLHSWVRLTIGSSFPGAQLACFEPISLLFFPDPATCPIVYSFNSVQIVNKLLYTMKNSE